MIIALASLAVAMTCIAGLSIAELWRKERQERSASLSLMAAQSTIGEQAAKIVALTTKLNEALRQLNGK